MTTTNQSQTPPTPVVTSTPQSRQDRLRKISILKARLAGIEKQIDTERAHLEMEMKQAGDMKVRVDEGDAFFRATRRPKVIDPKRLAELVPAPILAEFVKPTTAFVEGLQKAGTDWKSCIEMPSPEEFRIERARTNAAKEYYQRIVEETAQQADQVASAIAARLAPPAANPPAKQ